MNFGADTEKDMLHTNFENITESPEKLTSWLDEKMCFCTEISCHECIAYKECWHQGNDTDYSNAELWLEWLKRKCNHE